MVLNNEGRKLTLASRGAVQKSSTDAKQLYVDWSGGRAARYWAHEATFLETNGKAVFRRPVRGDVSVGKLR